MFSFFGWVSIPSHNYFGSVLIDNLVLFRPFSTRQVRANETAVKLLSQLTHIYHTTLFSCHVVLRRKFQITAIAVYHSVLTRSVVDL